MALDATAIVAAQLKRNPLEYRIRSLQIFISWSGKPSQAIAVGLRRLFSAIFPDSRPWVSSEDIDPGERWGHVLAAQLEASSFGVTCVVPSNLAEPWLHFEAGAIAKMVGEGRLVPLVHQVDPGALPGPLAQFQAVPCTEEGVGRLVRAVNRRSASPVDEGTLQERFEAAWPDFAEVVRTSSVERAPVRETQSAASLRVRMGYLGSWREEQIIIENVGQVTVTDLGVTIDGRPLEEAEFVLRQDLVDSLRPGDEFGIKIALSMESPERINLRLDWVDANGRPGALEKLLTLI